MLDDLRYAMRRLVQGKGWTLLVLLSCAIGIGASTVLFSLLDAVLLRPLALPDPQELVYLNWQSGPDALHVNLSGNSSVDESSGVRQSTSFSMLAFERMRTRSTTLAHTFAFAPLHEANVRVGGEAEQVNGQFVSGNYFEALRLTGVRGRPIQASDDRAGAPPAVVVSHALFERHFESVAEALGSTITINGQSFTIAGIAPAGFGGTHGFSFAAEFSIPLAFAPVLFPDDEYAEPWSWWLRVMGRLAPGSDAIRVQAELEPVFRAAARDGWDAAPRRSGTTASRDVPDLQVLDGRRGLADQVRNLAPLMSAFAGIAAILLLIVTVNVANMVLARTAIRQREIGVRLAIGASRARLARLLLVETVVLCLCAGLAGTLLAAWGNDLVSMFVAATDGTALQLRVDARVIAFALLTSLLTGIAVALGPAMRAARFDIVALVKHGAATLGRRSRMTRMLLVAQLALSLILLAGAGLLVRSVWSLHATSLGFDPDDLLLFELNPEAAGYDSERAAAAYEEIVQAASALPGVVAATTSDYPLVSGSGSGTAIRVQGSTLHPDDGIVRRLIVRSNFVQTMRLRIAQGRDFTPQDDRNAPRVALINRTLANRFFPGADPVGRRFGFGSVARSGDIEIVGVVEDASIDEVRAQIPPAIYLPYPQRVHEAATFEIRTTGDPMRFVPAIRQIVRHAAPDLPVVRIRTQKQQIASGFATERMLARISTLFAALALVLACVGLYGLLAYEVARRSSEIAVRMALGARNNLVVRMVLAEVGILILPGIAIGLGGALALTRGIHSLLYDVPPRDPITLAVAAVLLALVGAGAAVVPARRAANVEPWSALRTE